MEQMVSTSRPPGSFGRLLRAFRNRAYMSQEKLAARAELSERTVRYLEADQVRSPRTDTVRLLADALQLSKREREIWYDAAQGVSHAPGEPAAFGAGNPMRPPDGGRAHRPLYASGFGMRNYHRRLRSPTATHKAEIVGLCHRGNGSIGQVAKDADVTDAAAPAWADQTGHGTGATDNGGLASVDLGELAELRRETRRLREDVEILKRIAVHSIGQRSTAGCWMLPGGAGWPGWVVRG